MWFKHLFLELFVTLNFLSSFLVFNEFTAWKHWLTFKFARPSDWSYPMEGSTIAVSILCVCVLWVDVLNACLPSVRRMLFWVLCLNIKICSIFSEIIFCQSRALRHNPRISHVCFLLAYLQSPPPIPRCGSVSADNVQWISFHNQLWLLQGESHAKMPAIS